VTTVAVRRLLLAAAVAGALAVVVGGPVGLLALAAGLVAMAAAAGVAMRAGWAAYDDPPSTQDSPRSRAEHLAQVDAALDAGRHDLARDLVEAHRQELRRRGA
jgi:adenylosuccinate lyase